MAVWRIEAETRGREVYYVEAETEEQARRMFDDGDVPEPSVSEVLEAFATTVEEVSD